MVCTHIDAKSLENLLPGRCSRSSKWDTVFINFYVIFERISPQFPGSGIMIVPLFEHSAAPEQDREALFGHSAAPGRARAALFEPSAASGQAQAVSSNFLRLWGRLEQHFSHFRRLWSRLERQFRSFYGSGGGSSGLFEPSAAPGQVRVTLRSK